MIYRELFVDDSQDKVIYQKYLRKLKNIFPEYLKSSDDSAIHELLADYFEEDLDARYVLLLFVRIFEMFEDYLLSLTNKELAKLPRPFYDLPAMLFTMMVSLLISENDPAPCHEFLYDLSSIADDFEMTPMEEFFFGGLNTVLEHFDIELDS